MKNTMEDLNNHLFAELERLSDEELSPEELMKECERAKAISGISKNVISNAALLLKAAELKACYGESNIPKLIAGESEEKKNAINQAKAETRRLMSERI